MAQGAIRVGHCIADPGRAAASAFAAEIAFGDGRITRVSPLDRAALTAHEARAIALPGLANAHDHGRGVSNLAFGAIDGPLETWLAGLARAPRLDPYACAALAFAAMAGSGVCATNHCHNTQSSVTLLDEAEGVSRAARDVGIRVAFGWPFFDRNPVVYGDPAPLARWLPADEVPLAVPFRPAPRNFELIEQALAFEHPLFQIQYQPVGPQWCRDETLIAIAEASATTGRGVHMHMFETRRQREWADAAYAGEGGLVAFLDTIGLLSPRLTLAHGVWFEDDELALLGERGVNLSVNNSSNLRLRSGRAALPAMRRHGLSVGLGMDAMSLDDDDDMLREARLAWRFHAARLDTADIFDMACRTGRSGIVGQDGGGVIAVGAPADILVLDAEALLADRIGDGTALPALVLERATRRDVDRLFVAGREVVRGGMATGINAAALRARTIDQARAEARDNPPDLARIARMETALANYYAAGLHKESGR